MAVSYKILESKPKQILSLESVKNYMRISHDNDDSLIIEMIEAAIITAEDFIKYSLTQKIVEAVIYGSCEISLPLLPILEILQVIADGNIVEAGFSLNKNSITLPQLPYVQKLVVTYSAGISDPVHIPAPIKQALYIHIASMYDNRGNPAVLTDKIFDMYKPYRKMLI